MPRFQYALGLVEGRPPPKWFAETYGGPNSLITQGITKEDLRTLLWWWEGMLNKRGRRDEAAKVRKFRLRSLGVGKAKPKRRRSNDDVQQAEAD